jgi:hypothetical protein
MSRYSWLAAAAAVAFAAACAGTEADDVAESANSRTANTMAPSSAPPVHTAPAASFTDEQLRSFAAASKEINPIGSTLSTATPEQRAAATDQIRSILQQNNLDAATYNAIATQARSDPALAARIRDLSGGM